MAIVLLDGSPLDLDTIDSNSPEIPDGFGPVIYIPESTNIRRTEYHLNEQRLIIEFHSGARHQYSPVHEKTAKGLIDAPSAGRYFHEHIRAGLGIDSVRLPDSPEGKTV